MAIKQEYELFTAVWRLYRKYSEQPVIDWDKVVEEVDTLQARYKTVLCKDLLLAALCELERKDKDEERRNEN